MPPASEPGEPLRNTVRPDDRQQVRRLAGSTGVFSPAEIDVAVELVEERLAKGPASGYEFQFLDGPAGLLGYVCFGHIAVTRHSYDLYWIAVAKDQQGRGLGRRLLAAAEAAIAAAGGQRVYIETSGRADYEPTRQFYERCGYRREATLRDYYAPGDDRVIYVKALA